MCLKQMYLLTKSYSTVPQISQSYNSTGFIKESNSFMYKDIGIFVQLDINYLMCANFLLAFFINSGRANVNLPEVENKSPK